LVNSVFDVLRIQTAFTNKVKRLFRDYIEEALEMLKQTNVILYLPENIRELFEVVKELSIRGATKTELLAPLCAMIKTTAQDFHPSTVYIDRNAKSAAKLTLKPSLQFANPGDCPKQAALLER
jgi:hypothetical protein